MLTLSCSIMARENIVIFSCTGIKSHVFLDFLLRIKFEFKGCAALMQKISNEKKAETSIRSARHSTRCVC